MRLRVLGNTGRYLAPLSGGSSYLVEMDDARVLLDCGGGACRALAEMRIERLDAVVLSHFHFDHVMDFPSIRDALDARTVLIIPPGEQRRLDALAKAFAFAGAYDLPAPIMEAPLGKAMRVGPFTLSFAPTRHSAPSIATRLDAGDASIVYASDSTTCDTLRDLALDADVLLMHTLLPDVDPASSHAQRHATARTAATLARTARAERLVLSHRYFESVDADMLGAAAEHDRVELARDGAVIEP